MNWSVYHTVVQIFHVLKEVTMTATMQSYNEKPICCIQQSQRIKKIVRKRQKKTCPELKPGTLITCC